MTDSKKKTHVDENDSEAKSGWRQKRKQLPWYVEIPTVIVVTLLIVGLLQTFVGRLYVIPSESMQPTLNGCDTCTGDRIYVDKITYHFNDPKAGDIVVFKGTDDWNARYVSQRSSNIVKRGLQNLGSWIGVVAPDENVLVKRIIATGGQTVECRQGDAGVKVNGKVLDSSFVLDPPQRPHTDIRTGSNACGGDYFGPIKVPDNNIFVMGDNRTNSADSRYHLDDKYQGTIPKKNIIGKAQAIVLPFNRISTLSDYNLSK